MGLLMFKDVKHVLQLLPPKVAVRMQPMDKSVPLLVDFIVVVQRICKSVHQIGLLLEAYHLEELC